MVLKYLRTYQKKFKLGQIKFKVVYVRGKKVRDYYAEVLMRGNKVRIKFNEDLMEQKPKEIQDTVIHELLHVLFYRIMYKILNVIGANVRVTATQKRYEEKFCKLEHEVIEKLVSAFIGKTNRKT